MPYPLDPMPCCIGKTHATGSTNTLNMTDVPGAAQNDVMIAFIVMITGGTITGFTGWTLLNSWIGTNSNTYLYLIRRGGSAPSLAPTLAGGPSFWEYSLVSYRGCDTVNNPVHVSQFTAVHQGTTAPNPPSVTPTVNGCMIVGVGQKWGGSLTNPWRCSAGWWNREDGGVATNDITIEDLQQAAAAAIDPPAFLNNSTSSDTIAEGTIALMPPQAAPVGVVTYIGA